MKHCPKCHKKMQLGEGNIFVKVGDTEMKTVSAIYTCPTCQQHSADFQFRVQPINLIEADTSEKRGFNA